MSALYRPPLCWTGLVAADANQVITTMGDAMEALGLVQPSFVCAVREREASSPTGLPVVGRKVAVPHADPQHVIEAAIGVAVVAEPVAFREMGNPGSVLAVELVLLLALGDRASIQSELMRLVQAFQTPDFVERLCTAATPAALHARLLDGTRA